MGLIPCSASSSFFFLLIIILLGSLIFMLPMIQLKDHTPGNGLQIIFHLPLGSCVGTSISLRWLLIRTVFCLSAGQLESGKLGMICTINWVFSTPTPPITVLVGSGTLGLIWELALKEFLKGLIVLWYLCNHFSVSEDIYLPVTPLVDVTLLDHFPIKFSIEWQIAR